MTEAKQATPHSQLISELMDSRVPKTEREHAAAREIERLRAALEKPEQVPVAWLSRDEARLALWQAIHQREFGNPNDDKLILDALRDKGLWIGRISASPERAALEQPEQKPVAWRVGESYWTSYDEIPARLLPPMSNPQPLYLHPPRREWQGLTDGEIDMIYAQPQTHKGQYARAIEAALKERNT